MAKQTDASSMNRRQQFAETYRITKRTDPRIGWWLLLTFLVTGVLGFLLFKILPGSGAIEWVLSVIGGIMFGTLGALILFSRRAQASAYSQMEGQPGAAAASLNMLKRGWNVDTAVAFNRQQDVVHRVVGPPGILLVGEGNGSRLRALMAGERRKHERVVAETPVHEIVVGREEGQVPLPQLMKKLRKMKREVRPADITDIRARLKALDASRPAVPLPKGPVPTSMKGMRQNMRGR
ncbi:MAG: DUF4191 domain-containing protein [Nocardioides marinisabuli]|uniref:DUF4191 domain-containing protein n=1 Tax=Nocardioides marinisabuli TaxID=419476 RepID=UPI00321A4AFE